MIEYFYLIVILDCDLGQTEKSNFITKGSSLIPNLKKNKKQRKSLH